MAVAQFSSGFCLAPWCLSSFSPPSSSSLRRKLTSSSSHVVMEFHGKPLPFNMTSKQTRHEEAWRRFSAVAASLSSASHEDDSTSFPSKELGPKVDLNLPRRRLQVSFTCDACGVRSRRLINPNAYTRGTVFVQCAGCEVYHQLVDNLGLIVEYDFRKEANSNADESDSNVLE